MAAAEITLNCWICGLDDANAFSVDILPSKTVDHLKKAIKEVKRPELDHLATDKLDIWKVSDLMQRTRPLVMCHDTFAAQETPCKCWGHWQST